MEIKQLKCFLILSKTLNFSRTAELMYLSQPAVSMSIRQLEEELGLALFVRNKRKVELTTAGKFFAKKSERLLQDLEKSITETRSLAVQYNSALNVMYEENKFAITYFPQLLHKYRMKYPKTQVALQLESSPFLKYQFLESTADILFTVRRGQLPHGLSYAELLKSRVICQYQPDFFNFKNNQITPEDLIGIQLILMGSACCPPELLDITEQMEHLFSKSSILYCDSISSIYTYIRSGLGVAIIPDFAGRPERELSELPVRMECPFSYGMYYHTDYLTDEAKKFMKLALDYFRELGY